VELSARVRTIAMRARHPRHVDVAQQVEIAPTLARRLLDPRRTVAVVVSSVHDGAHEVRVQHHESGRAANEAIVHLDLAAGDRLDVARIQGRARIGGLPVGVEARELGYACPAELPREISGERRLPRGLGSGYDDKWHSAALD